jgi:hypothetical protein
LVVLDVDTGSVYGEYHEQESTKDLIGFFARAWSKKALHPMRGVPQVLNVPAIALKDEAYRTGLEFVVRHAAVKLGELPSGFSASVHALKQLERGVESLTYRGGGDREVDLYMIHATSGVVSMEASNSLSHMWQKSWEALSPPEEFLEAVDALYQEHGAWRSGPFELVLNGLPSEP